MHESQTYRRTTPISLSAVRCRQIVDADIPGVEELLTKGFPRRSRTHWRRALHRLAKHPTPTAMPKYGYLLESAGIPVGVVLLISSVVQEGNIETIRCNVSSWYVEPDFRIHAPLLVSQAIRKQNVVYFNISPAKHTHPIIEAQGFSRYSSGQFVTFASLPTRRDPTPVVGPNVNPDAYFEPFERDLLLTHSQYGCLSLWCVTPERAFPFVFLPRVTKGIVPCVQLIYCTCVEDFVRFARPLGMYLWSRGWPLVIIDSNGPIRGLRGLYFGGVAPKYFRGPMPPRLGDLAYTEAAMFEADDFAWITLTRSKR
jgi:hypothetical protein